jgi:MinD superfamily P-loop ATPase
LKQLVILSGKGGTGKTSLAAAFAHLAYAGPQPINAVLADADVDAANLELVLQARHIETHDFTGGSVASIDLEHCQDCGICEEICRFDAIHDNGQGYAVDPIACDGCAACVYQCPEEAIMMHPQIVGQWYHSECLYGPLIHADLQPAQENSGKLVTMVKQIARLLAIDTGSQMVIIDGPPGIGCPVISALSGADMLLIISEPSSAGIHDMERVLHLAQYFQLPSAVCINKADIYPAGKNKIIDYCEHNQIDVIGEIPYDEAVTLAMVHGKPVTVYLPSAPASLAIQQIWSEVTSRMLTGSK